MWAHLVWAERQSQKKKPTTQCVGISESVAAVCAPIGDYNNGCNVPSEATFS